MIWYLKTSNILAYKKLMRMDKPIGTYLLLWPTLWALWVASNGVPHWHYLLVFITGTFLMRSAGCVINDYADRNIDGMVERTKDRPLASKQVTEKEALSLFSLLVFIAFLLVLTIDIPTVLLSVVALLLAASYPFMKRYTFYPQIVLGAAFSWAIPMSFMAVQADLPPEVWLLYFANLTWTVAYDTFYAMVDREDDLKIGVKSTAIAFGDYDLLMIAILQLTTIYMLFQTALLMGWHWPMLAALFIVSCLFIRQLWLTRHRNKQACFDAFLNNHYVGMTIFVGIAIEYALF